MTSATVRRWFLGAFACAATFVLAPFAPARDADDSAPPSPTFAPIWLTATDLTIATGTPSLVSASDGSAHVPAWSLSGMTAGQSVAGLVPDLPEGCGGVKIAIVVATTDESTRADFEDVYRVRTSQFSENGAFATRRVVGAPVRTPLPAEPFRTRTIVLESYCAVDPRAPLAVRIERVPDDPADSFSRPALLLAVKIAPLAPLASARVVQDVPGYNSWPMIEAIGGRLVCFYSRGSGHTIAEDARAVYARTSDDGGRTQGPETLVSNAPESGEVAVGKGRDSTGAALFWSRRIGKEWNFDLYRTENGVDFALLATPKLDPTPVQITDVFAVPSVGLTALWFAGDYSDDGPTHSWGTLTSADDGATWKQTTVESGLTKADWPTEPAAARLDDGRIIALARTESNAETTERAQFQMTSTDDGATWKRERTNVGDVLASTPSLIYDAKTGLLSVYYYHRGRGVLRRLVVDPNDVFDAPRAWPPSEGVALGSDATFDAGNANATEIDGVHYVAYYSGKTPNASILTAAIPAPTRAPSVETSEQSAE